MISIIVAIAEKNYAIGYNNKLLWSLPNDMKRFVDTTTGNTVVMGRNTFLSLPGGALPKRKNVVISDIEGEKFEGCTMATSIEHAIDITKDDGEVFIIGGASIYKQFLPYADRLYLTMVDDEPQADTYFPRLNPDEWKLVFEEEHEKDEKHCVNYRFLTFDRVKDIR